MIGKVLVVSVEMFCSWLIQLWISDVWGMPVSLWLLMNLAVACLKKCMTTGAAACVVHLAVNWTNVLTTCWCGVAWLILTDLFWSCTAKLSSKVCDHAKGSRIMRAIHSTECYEETDQHWFHDDQWFVLSLILCMLIRGSCEILTHQGERYDHVLIRTGPAADPLLFADAVQRSSAYRITGLVTVVDSGMLLVCRK